VWSLALVLGTNFVLNGVPHVSGAVVSFGVETSIDKGLGPIGVFAPEPIPSCGDVWITWHGYGADGISRQWAYAVSADGRSDYQTLLPPWEMIDTIVRDVQGAALPDGRILVVWRALGEGLRGAVHLPDGSWRGPFTIIQEPLAEEFDVDADEFGAFIVWIDTFMPAHRLFVARLSMETFLPEIQQLVDDSANESKGHPRLKLNGGEAHVVWTRSGSEVSSVLYSLVTFQARPPIPMSVSPNAISIMEILPDLGVFPDGSVVVGFESLAFPFGVFAATLRDNGFAFDSPFSLGALLGAELPRAIRLEVDPDGDLHAVWLDGDIATQTSGFRVMYSRSTGGARDFTPPIRLDGDPTMSSKEGPRMSIGPGGDLYVAWGDRRDGGSATPYVVRGMLSVPHPQITLSADFGILGDEFHFSAESSENGGRVLVDFNWDFGDGSTAEGPTARHSFANPGVFTVLLTIVDDQGAMWSSCATIRVSPNLALRPVRHPSGFVIGAPETWTVLRDLQDARFREDVLEVALLAPPTAAVRGNITIDWLAGSSPPRDSEGNVVLSVENYLTTLRNLFPDARIASPEESREIPGLVAVAAVVDHGPSNLTQRVTVVADASSHRWWAILLTTDDDSFALLDPLFERVLSTFALLRSEVEREAVPLGMLVLAAAIAGAEVAVAIAFLPRRRRRRGESRRSSPPS